MKASSDLKGEWEQLATTTHQDHLIAHVIGAKVLAYWIHDESIHILLDMEFIWTIYVDGQMSLLSYPIAIADLEIEDQARVDIKLEVQNVLSGIPISQQQVLRQMEGECVVDEVITYSTGKKRLFVIKGENGRLLIESNLETGEIVVAFETQ